MMTRRRRSATVALLVARGFGQSLTGREKAPCEPWVGAEGSELGADVPCGWLGIYIRLSLAGPKSEIGTQFVGSCQLLSKPWSPGGESL